MFGKTKCLQYTSETVHYLISRRSGSWLDSSICIKKPALISHYSMQWIFYRSIRYLGENISHSRNMAQHFRIQWHQAFKNPIVQEGKRQ